MFNLTKDDDQSLLWSAFISLVVFVGASELTKALYRVAKGILIHFVSRHSVMHSYTFTIAKGKARFSYIKYYDPGRF